MCVIIKKYKRFNNNRPLNGLVIFKLPRVPHKVWVFIIVDFLFPVVSTIIFLTLLESPQSRKATVEAALVYVYSRPA